jgi:hypothetical protein
MSIGLLQHGRVAVVVLRGDHHEGVGVADPIDVRLHRGLRLLRVRHGQVDVDEVDDIERHVGALFGVGDEPGRDGAAEAAFTGAADDDGHLEGCVGHVRPFGGPVARVSTGELRA